jgi:hypothetical protein
VSKIIVSPDISVLDFSVLIDMSMAVPTASVTNLSTVINPLALDWAFEFTSPNGTPIHIGDINTPDIDNAAFIDYPITEPIPQIFGQMEFSAVSGYKVKVIVKDSEGNVNSLEKVASLCKPNGNNGKNNFGAAIVEIETKCDKGQLYVVDKTNLIYKSLVGQKISSTIDVDYPKDAYGNTVPSVSVNTIPALIPIKSDGDGHDIYVVHIFQYDLGDSFFVKIRYSFRDSFAVWCSVDLCPLFCEIDKLTAAVAKNCDIVTKTEQNFQLQQINAKMLKAVVGTLQPLCKFDVPAIIEDIKEKGGFTCDCCRPKGIAAPGNVLVADANFTVNKLGGDMLLSWEVDEFGNIQLNYQNFSYVFALCPDRVDKTNSTAFELVPSTTGFVKTTCLFVDKTVLAAEMLAEIKNNSELTDLLNLMVTSSSSSLCSGINGYDIVQCDYQATIVTGIIPKSIISIVIGANTYTAPGGGISVFDDTAVAIWLNSLGLGTFAVVYDSLNNKTTITTSNNSNSVSTLLTADIAHEETIAFVGSCTLICHILQSILTYVKEISLLKIGSGGNFKICSLTTKGVAYEENFDSSNTAFEVVSAMATSLCSIVSRFTKGPILPAVISNSFADFTNTTGDPDGFDIVLGMKNGVPQKFPIKNLALGIFKLLGSDVDVKSIFCTFGTCTSVSNCIPVTALNVTMGETTALLGWTAAVGAVSYKYSIDGLTWIPVLGTSAYITGLTVSTSYTFYVYPVFSNGDGSNCIETIVGVTTAAGVCSAPGSYTSSEVGIDSAVISWNAVAGATGYQYQINGGSWVSIGNVLTYQLNGLASSTLYNVAVRAIIAGVPCVTSATTSFTTLVAGGFLINNLSVSTLNDVTSGLDILYTYATGAFPLATGETVTGSTVDFIGIITVDATINMGGPGTITISLIKNGIVEQSISGVTGLNAFATQVISAGDNFEVRLTD